MKVVLVALVVGSLALACSVALAERVEPSWKDYWCEAKPEVGTRIPWGDGPLNNGNFGRWVRTYPPNETAEDAKQRFATQNRARGVKSVGGSIQCDEDPRKVYP